ncbi:MULTISPECIES: hypothetical protein [Rhodopseudomonas]|uniref:Uncharacterized protein n=1 Tax=Rhodopseudomonas palustris TaxID=1076 RepID=A0A0D7F4Y0_RHOPL|nr:MULTISPECIES: hypothetical protein [Rhodopseudomonas]KIZ47841.1 hypothetical protein OO17_02170 [Rhodopseudomonas palustris]MDF3811044.1 hypothetical protein [Rhodopseudomonas sp. BAL398]WOK15940.1 hypothetical protein RBJ75_17405 [Rhodopseudomonas sp. BAL398]
MQNDCDIIARYAHEIRFAEGYYAGFPSLYFTRLAVAVAADDLWPLIPEPSAAELDATAAELFEST